MKPPLGPRMYCLGIYWIGRVSGRAYCIGCGAAFNDLCCSKSLRLVLCFESRLLFLRARLKLPWKKFRTITSGSLAVLPYMVCLAHLKRCWQPEFDYSDRLADEFVRVAFIEVARMAYRLFGVLTFGGSTCNCLVVYGLFEHTFAPDCFVLFSSLATMW